MNISTTEVEEIRALLSRGDFLSLSNLSVHSIDLGAATELACYRLVHSKDSSVTKLFSNWSEQSPILFAAIQMALSRRLPTRDAMFVPRAFEFFPISRSNWDDNDHHLFEGRLDAALRGAGFGLKSISLVGAFHEMADNVLQHSASPGGGRPSGILGYHVYEGTMSFSVGDVGRGALQSLRDNPQWSHLSDSVEALHAIVSEGASRRAMGGCGEGFKQLFRSLADLNGTIALRTGNGSMSIKGTPDGRTSESALATPFSGLQLAVACSITSGRKNSC